MSCAGTIGTCTHGTGKDYGLLATFVSNKLFILNKLQSRIKYILTCYMLDGKILTEIYMYKNLILNKILLGTTHALHVSPL